MYMSDLFLKAKINATKIMRMFLPMIGQFFWYRIKVLKSAWNYFEPPTTFKVAGNSLQHFNQLMLQSW